ncbi:MAG TPA: cation diffusion facilitator family transporter [Polyangiaceae bacterium]|nr:cation diffusion facilitator family transporter [Polyangiaceae bacterium]
MEHHPPASGVAKGEPSSSHLHGTTFSVAEARQARRLGVVLAIIAVFFIFELLGAIAARSQVLKADALHLLMDVFAISMSLLAMKLAVRRPTPRFTFGLRRAEPVAAIFNAVLVLGGTVEIVREAVDELRGREEAPAATVMLLVSIAALVVNGLSAWLLHDVIGHHGHAHHAHAHHGHAHDHAREEPARGGGHGLNLRGARLHLLGDALGSLAALIAAIAIRAGGPPSIDAFASFLVAIILVLGALGLLRDATLVLLEAAPVHLPVAAVRAVVRNFPGVREVHDMHVWTLGAGHDAIIVHVRSDDGDLELAARLSKKLRAEFSCEYVTVQVEKTDAACDAPLAQSE